MFTKVLVLVLIFDVAKSKIEPKVVQGDQADIRYYAHSVYLHMSTGDGAYVCGSSILNQKVLLTAAHCVEKCIDEYCINGFAYSGHIHKGKGGKSKIAKYLAHEKYNRRGVQNDIGLVLLQRPLKFGDLVKRIAIMRWPPSKKTAVIAGWGLTKELPYKRETDYLQSAELKVWSYEQCRYIISSLPKGCLCAGQERGKSYAAQGDSGSALVIDGFVQIGIVSYKRPDISLSVVAFTNVTYFYDWITRNSKRLYCRSQ